jgi:C_GCAxxG_C_C family probable redox protein
VSRDINAIVTRAEQLFREKYHCSEALAIALSEAMEGRVSAEQVRIASAFGGGMGGSHEETCGVLTGAIIALGSKYGRVAPPDPYPELRPQIQVMRDRFVAQFGATRCDTLRLALPDVDNRCMPMITGGTRLIAEYLQEVGLL